MAAQSFVAGWFGGVCVLAVCHPFDTLKVRIQGASFDSRNLVDLEAKIKEREARLAALESRAAAARSGLGGGSNWSTAFREALTGANCKYRRALARRFHERHHQRLLGACSQTAAAAGGGATDTAAEFGANTKPTLHVNAVLSSALADGASSAATATTVGASTAATTTAAAAAAATKKGAGGVARPICTAPIRLSSSDTLSVMRDILHNEGPRGFYRGLAAPLSGVGLATAAQFGVFGYVSNYLSRKRYGGDVHNLSDHLQNANSLDVLDKVISATCGGVAYAVIIAPFEMVKVRLQTQIFFGHRKYFGALGCGRKLYSEGGLRKLYLGIDVMLMRDIIGSVVYFGSYGLLRQVLPQGDTRESIASTLFAGGCAGVTQWALIFPLDTIKTRQQIAKQGTYLDWVHCGRVLYRKDGWRSFYYGVGPALIRAFMGNAICFGGVEAAMAAMERLEVRRDREEWE